MPDAEKKEPVACISTKPRRASWMPTSSGRPEGANTTVAKAAASRNIDRPVYTPAATEEALMVGTERGEGD